MNVIVMSGRNNFFSHRCRTCALCENKLEFLSFQGKGNRDMNVLKMKIKIQYSFATTI